MRSILLDLNQNSANIEASAIVSNNGLVIESVFPDRLNEDHIAAMSSGLCSFGSRSSEALANGAMEQIMVQGSEGLILITKLGKAGLLAVITNTVAELDAILAETKHAAEKIKAYF